MTVLFLVMGIGSLFLGALIVGDGGFGGFLGAVLLICGLFLTGFGSFMVFSDLKTKIKSFDPKTHMSAKKKEMAQFYRQCVREGYTDMSDDTQSLKAKVIATDMGLKYGDIASFFEKARRCSEEASEKEAITRDKQARVSAEARQEAARRAINGELLLTFNLENSKTPVKVYIRPDKSVYRIVGNSGKIEGPPRLTVKQYESASFTYHPAKATYTGVTVGRVTTGGVNVTPAGYTSRNFKTGRGIIQIAVGTQAADVKSVTPSPYTKDRFKRDEEFRKRTASGSIRCMSGADNSSMAGVTGSALPMDMNMVSALMAGQYYSMNVCQEIVSLLERIMRGSFPPTDEEYYERARELLKAKDSVSLSQAMALFEKIRDYRDAAQQAQAAQKKYQEALQTEKEQAILEDERRRKKNRPVYITVALLAALAAAAGAVFFTVVQPARARNAYRETFSALKVGDTFFFGQYEQDGNADNGAEPIQWRVLDIDNGRALVISRYLLDSRQFYADTSKYPDMGWKNSALRSWLNSAFYEAAFSAKERPLIEKYNTGESDRPIKDNVFVLSYSEFNKYIGDGKDPCTPTASAKSAAVLAKKRTNVLSSGWWLRTRPSTTGLSSSDVYAVSFDSGELYKKSAVNFSSYGTNYGYSNYVRPAIWIDVSWIE